MTTLMVLSGACSSSNSTSTSSDKYTHYYISVKNAININDESFPSNSSKFKVRVASIMRRYENIMPEGIKVAHAYNGNTQIVRLTDEGNESDLGALQEGDVISLYADDKMIYKFTVDSRFLSNKKKSLKAIDANQMQYILQFIHDGTMIDTPVYLSAIKDVNGVNILNNLRDYITIKPSYGKLLLIVNETDKGGLSVLDDSYQLEFEADGYVIAPYSPTTDFLNGKSTSLRALKTINQYKYEFHVYKEHKRDVMVDQFIQAESLIRDGINLLNNKDGKVVANSSLKGINRIRISIVDENDSGLRPNDQIEFKSRTYSIEPYVVSTESATISNPITTSSSTNVLMGSSNLPTCDSATGFASAIGCNPDITSSFEESCGCTPEYTVDYLGILSQSDMAYDQNNQCSTEGDSTDNCNYETNGIYEFKYEYTDQTATIGFIFDAGTEDGTATWFFNNIYPKDSDGNYILINDDPSLKDYIPGSGNYATCGTLTILDDNIQANSKIGNEAGQIQLPVCIIRGYHFPYHVWSIAPRFDATEIQAGVLAACFSPMASYDVSSVHAIGFNGVTKFDAQQQGWGKYNCACIINGTWCNEESNQFAIIKDVETVWKGAMKAAMVVKLNGYKVSQSAETEEDFSYDDDGE